MVKVTIELSKLEIEMLINCIEAALDTKHMPGEKEQRIHDIRKQFSEEITNELIRIFLLFIQENCPFRVIPSDEGDSVQNIKCIPPTLTSDGFITFDITIPTNGARSFVISAPDYSEIDKDLLKEVMFWRLE